MSKFIFIILSILFLSCSSSSMITYTDENKNEYLLSYLNRNTSIQSFEGDADITLNFYEAGKLEKQNFNAKIFWNRNDSLAIEMNYGVMGINLADVAKLYVGKNNYVFVTRENLFLTGLSDDSYLNELFRIDIPLKKWAPKLFMCILFEESDDLQTTLENNQLILRQDDKKVIFRHDLPLPKTYEFLSESSHKVTIEYEGLIETEKFQFPQRVVYYNASDRSEVIINYNSIKVNKRLPKKGFEVKIPSQMEQIIYD